MNIFLSYNTQDKIWCVSGLHIKQLFLFDSGDLILDFISKPFDYVDRGYRITQHGFRIISDVKQLRKKFKFLIEFCYNNKSGLTKRMHSLSPLKRFSLYCMLFDPSGFWRELQLNVKYVPPTIPNNINAEAAIQYTMSDNPEDKIKLLELVANMDTPSFNEEYQIQTLEELLFMDFYKMLQNCLVVNKCENCKNYFIPKGRIDSEYCDRFIIGTNKTCRDIGATKKYAKKIKDNPILSAFNKEYKKRSGRVRIKKMSQTDFYNWSEKARDLRDEALKKDLSPEVINTLKNDLEKLEV